MRSCNLVFYSLGAREWKLMKFNVNINEHFQKYEYWKIFFRPRSAFSVFSFSVFLVGNLIILKIDNPPITTLFISKVK